MATKTEEPYFVQTPSSSSSSKPTLTCISCRMMFHTTKEQREHYKSDYHRFNLKRKVANLPPVTLQIFQEKVEILVSQSKTEDSSLECKTCGKTYASANSFKQHLKSKKHLEKLQESSRALKEELGLQDAKHADELPETLPSPPVKAKPEQSSAEEQKMLEDFTQVKSAESVENLTEQAIATNEEEEEMIDEKLKQARFLSEEECLFCNVKSEDFDQNMLHMTNVHGFFIPDIEYLKDLKGLIKYLGEKISVGNVCIHCNGKGRSFYSLEAVQSHMRAQCHCKMLYEDGNEGEYDDFYDFSNDYSHLPKTEEDEDVQDLIHSNAKLADDGHHLVFSDGRLVGHRSLALYYKQRYKPEDRRDAVIISKLQNQYKQIGWTDTSHPANFDKKNRQDLHRQAYERTRLEIKANSLQKFRNTQTAFL